MDYYEVKKVEHKKSCMCKMCVDWNIEAISKCNNASGYIVQKFSRKLITDFDIQIPKDIAYFEAWKVIDGVLKDKGTICDDMFSIGCDMQYFDLFKKCAGTSGRYEFNGDVFWISNGNVLYNLVNSWKPVVKEANGLKSIFSCDVFDELAPFFSRNPFTHEWDLTKEDIIYNEAKRILFRYCHKGERELLLKEIDNLLPQQYIEVKERIIEDWNNL